VYEQLRAEFRWVDGELSDPAGWWRDAKLLAWIGAALADPYRSAGVTVVVGPESRGFLVGGLVARELGAGFIEAYKHEAYKHEAYKHEAYKHEAYKHEAYKQEAYKHEAYKQEAYKHDALRSDEVLVSEPLAVRSRLLSPVDRVLAVDDWLDTGRQLAAVESIVAAAGAVYVGAAVIAAARPHPGVHALIEVADLG